MSGLAIDGNDMIYAADSESDPKERIPAGCKGIRIGSLKDGKVTIFVPPHRNRCARWSHGRGDRHR